MGFIIDLQIWVIQSYPTLLPALAIALFFIQSWHCAMMCGPIVTSKKSRTEQNLYLQARILSYSLAGAVAGGLGHSLIENSDLETLKILSFVVFFAITVTLVLLWFFKVSPYKFLPLPKGFLGRSRRRLNASAFTQGLLSVSIPCPLIFQMLTLALASQSWLGGLMVGLGHSVATTPALWKSAYWLKKLNLKSKRLSLLIQTVILVFIAFQLFYYFGRLTSNDDSHLEKFLFCF